jgi:hypothetical protein
MGIHITKGKTVKKNSVVKGKNKVVSELEKWATVYFDTQIELEAAQLVLGKSRVYQEVLSKEERLREVTKELVELAESSYSAKEEVPVVTLEGDLTIGAKALKRTVKDKPKLIKLLGQSLFNKLAEVKLGDIDKHLTEDEKVKVLDSDHVGPRKISSRRRRVGSK